MKKLNIKSALFYTILLSMVVLGISSCKKNKLGGDGPPSITRVRTLYRNVTDSNVVHPITLDSNSVYNQPGIAALDSTTTDGKIGTQYVIIGNNLASTTSLSLNGVSIYFNEAYLSNTTLQFSIPNTVPYSSSKTSNILTLVNPHGKVDFKFVIEQPPPFITSASQLAGDPGDIISVSGSTFNGLSGVSFGTIPAQVLSTTVDLPTQITTLKVKVPAGVTYAPIVVTTAATKGGGPGSGPVLTAGKSLLSNGTSAVHFANAIFGFNTAVFEDSFENSWSDYGWSNSPTTDNTLARRGTTSIKASYGGGYDAFVIQPGNGAGVTTKTAIKFSIYGGKNTDGKHIHLILNYNFNVAVEITLTEGKWVDYLIPVVGFVDSSNPLPSSINALVFQEFSGNASVFNMDDVGLVEINPLKK